MKKWITEIRAISLHGELTTYAGPDVPGLTASDAQKYCESNGLGYCKVIGELVAEVPLNINGLPDWSKRTDYDFDLN